MTAQTFASFENMLKDYMPYELLKEELTKRDYFLLKVEKDDKWTGGPLQVPFRQGKASSMAFAQLTAEPDVVEQRNLRGEVAGYKELWGTMVFNDHDLHRHGDMEKSFLKILPDTIEDFVSDMKETVSINLLNGAHIASVTGVAAPNGAIGEVDIDRPARLEIGQFLDVGIVGTLRTSGYVQSVDISLKRIVLRANKDLTGVLDLDAAGVLATDKLFIRGAITVGNTFTSLKDQFLSLANGGSANLFGVPKLSAPHLQTVNIDGSGITAANILAQTFDAYNETRTLGKGAPTDVVMSFKHLGSVMKALELAREYTGVQSSANVYGWTEIDIVGVKGKLKFVGVQEMDDDVIYMIDWRGIKLHSNGMFERRQNPEGNRSFYEVRASTGYQYFVDTRFFGELVVNKPSHQGVIHTIAY